MTTIQQKLMAQLLSLNPNDESDWPMETINRLVAIDNEKGRKALLREIHYMTTPPPKSTAETIADMVVEKLIARGLVK